MKGLGAALFCLLSFAFSAAPAEETGRLVAIQSAFEREMLEAENEFKTSHRQLRAGYRGSLQRLLDANISSGNSTLVLSLNDEMARLDSGKPLPAEPDESLPRRIYELRVKFLGAENALLEERTRKENELREVGIRALTELSRATTRTGDIEAVRKIENQIEEWKEAMTAPEDIGMASIVPDGDGDLERFRQNQILWTDKEVPILKIPDELEGLYFNFTGKELNSVRATSRGKVYALTAAPNAGNDRSKDLASLGFSRSSIDSFQLYGAHPADLVQIFEKVVEEGEVLTFRKFAIVLGDR